MHVSRLALRRDRAVHRHSRREAAAHRGPSRLPAIRSTNIAAWCSPIWAEQPVPTFDLPRKQILEDERPINPGAQVGLGLQLVPARRKFARCGTCQLRSPVGQRRAIRIVGNRLDSGTVVFGNQRRHPAGRNASEQQRPGQRLDVSQQQSRGGAGLEKDEPWVHVSAWPTPIDDISTMRFVIVSLETDDPVEAGEDQGAIRLGLQPDRSLRRTVPSGSYRRRERIRPAERAGLRGGARSGRHLRPHAGEPVDLRCRRRIPSRRILLRELEAIRLGRPTKQWSRIEHAEHLAAPPPVQAAE